VRVRATGWSEVLGARLHVRRAWRESETNDSRRFHPPNLGKAVRDAVRGNVSKSRPRYSKRPRRRGFSVSSVESWPETFAELLARAAVEEVERRSG
jgi:hypothetical protein